MPIPLKVKFGDSVRRFSIDDNETFDSLQALLVSKFPAAHAPLSLHYIDDDGDVVMLSSNPELAELFRLYLSSNMSVLRLTINGTNTNFDPRDSAPAHTSGMATDATETTRQGVTAAMDAPREAPTPSPVPGPAPAPNSTRNTSNGNNFVPPPQFGTQPVPQMDALFSGLATFLSELGTNINRTVNDATRGIPEAFPTPPAPPMPPFAPVPPPFCFPPPPPGARAEWARHAHGGGYRPGSWGHGWQGPRRGHGHRGAHNEFHWTPFGMGSGRGPRNASGGADMGGNVPAFTPIITALNAFVAAAALASEETRRAALNARSAALNVSRDALRTASAAVAPIVANWLAELTSQSDSSNDGQAQTQAQSQTQGQNIGTNDRVPESAIESLTGAVDDAVRPHGGESLSNAVCNLLRTALVDGAIVRALRTIPSNVIREAASCLGNDGNVEMFADMMGCGENRANNVGTLKFKTHVGVQCNVCGCLPIIGTRYKALNRDDYDVCGTCIDEGKVNPEQDGLELKKCPYVWTLELGEDAKVPEAPLMRGDSGARVALLQKALTDVGLMSGNMYARRVGFYGRKTERAVREFQLKFGLGDAAQELGVYDAVTSASLLSVLEVGLSGTDGATSTDRAQSNNSSEAGPSQTPAQA